MPKKKQMKRKPAVNPELDGLEININEFGEIITNYDVQDINRFLNRNVDDKKLRDRTDISDEGEFLNSDSGEGKPEEEELFSPENENVDLDKLRSGEIEEEGKEEEDTKADGEKTS